MMGLERKKYTHPGASIGKWRESILFSCDRLKSKELKDSFYTGGIPYPRSITPPALLPGVRGGAKLCSHAWPSALRLPRAVDEGIQVLKRSNTTKCMNLNIKSE
jgi:hypothetical protein